MWASVLVIASTVFAPRVAQDTLVVRADNAPIWGTDLSLVEELRLGVLDGPVEEAFTEIRGFVTLDDGELWIGDGASVRRFTESGRFIGELGREGEGPGEFKGIAGMKRMPDGRVVVFDPWVGRLSYFSPDGSFLSSSPRAIGVVLARHELLEVDSDGNLYQYWIRLDADSGRGIPCGTSWTKPASRSIRSRGRPADEPCWVDRATSSGTSALSLPAP